MTLLARDVNFLAGDLEVVSGDLKILSPDETELKALIRCLLTHPDNYAHVVREGDSLLQIDDDYGSSLRKYIGSPINEILPSKIIEAVNKVADKNFRIKITSIKVSAMASSKEVKMDIVYESLGEKTQRLATLYIPSEAKLYV